MTHSIYFARRRDGLVKIGTTNNITRRISQLQKSHGLLEVIRVINGDKKREGQLHHQFRAFHEYGEWFRDDDGKLVELIRRLGSGTAVEVTQDEMRAEWLAGEARLATKARRLLHEMTQARMMLTGLRRADAQEAIAQDYGFSPWFLEYVRRKNGASSISAYGMQKIREAWAAEKTAQVDFLKSEMEALEAEETRLRAQS